MNCNFIKELSKLRKLSVESVDNADIYSDFQDYMHVVRDLEIDLMDLIDQVKFDDKVLILLCGSAGDGKSHLLAYLKKKGLLDGYDIYNDATESISPEKTSLETLSIKLQEFNDTNINNKNKSKVIIAINLGTLNNFIDSEYGQNYQSLNNYIKVNNILSDNKSDGQIKILPCIHHISFADYHLFELNSTGINSKYIEDLFSKVFQEDKGNLFYSAYIDGSKCTLCEECPVRCNYEFLLNEKYRKNIINRIIEVIIKDKYIVSTREILNFIYDILVHPSLEGKTINELRLKPTKEYDFFSSFLDYTTPMLLDDVKDISPFMNSIRKYDPLLVRKNEIDSLFIRFNSEENIWDEYEAIVKNLPYNRITSKHKYIVSVNTKLISLELKRKLLKFIFRTQNLVSDNEFDPTLKNYINNLYYYNRGDNKQLFQLMRACIGAILKWNGDFYSKELCCIDDTNDFYYIVESLNIQPKQIAKPKLMDECIKHFDQVITFSFESKDNDKPVNLYIDYDLFKLFEDINNGYHPTAHDKNQYADFAGVIKKVQRLGKLNEQVILIAKTTGLKNRIKFTNEFGMYSVVWDNEVH